MMTKRDEFAIAYMAAYVQGQLVGDQQAGAHDPHKAIASRAYDMAEAMMKESEARAQAKFNPTN